MLTCGAPVPAFCVSPTLFSGLPTLPLLTADIPGRALRETFRGLQQTVRLLGASDVGRVGGGGRAQAGGWGDCTPPTPHFSTGHPAGGGGGWHSQTGRGSCLGRWGASPAYSPPRAPSCPLNKTQVLLVAHNALPDLPSPPPTPPRSLCSSHMGLLVVPPMCQAHPTPGPLHVLFPLPPDLLVH